MDGKHDGDDNDGFFVEIDKIDRQRKSECDVSEWVSKRDGRKNEWFSLATFMFDGGGIQFHHSKSSF